MRSVWQSQRKGSIRKHKGGGSQKNEENIIEFHPFQGILSFLHSRPPVGLKLNYENHISNLILNNLSYEYVTIILSQLSCCYYHYRCAAPKPLL